jgi:outer membrane protein insertion porin family
MIRRVISLSLFIICVIQLYPQQNVQVISNILVFGNTRTKEDVIRKALNLEKGQPFRPEIIEMSRKRLLELNLFSVVEIEAKKSDRGMDLFVLVKERSPLFFEFTSDYSNEIYNYFLGMKTGLRNLWGKNQDLWLVATIGDSKKLGIGYENRYHLDFFWGLSLENVWHKNEFYDFKESRLTGKIFAGKRISRFETYLWADYERIQINLGASSNQNPGELYKSGVQISYDGKDWKVFPSRGIFAQTGFYKALDGKMRTVYNRYSFEFSSFFSLWKGHVLSFDLRSTISEKDVPLYDRLYFGGANTLRGYSRWTNSGNNSVVLTTEYRVPVSLKKNSLEKSTTGSALYLFSDLGSLTEKKEDLRLKNFKSDFGIGFFWVIMEISKLRIDMSVAPKVRFVIGSDWKF